MSIPSETETTTIKLTISLEHKKTLEKAAAQRKVSLNDYLLEIALEAAEKVSLSMTPEEMVLSERDWDIFISALENPPEPNEALKAAIKEYQEEYGTW